MPSDELEALTSLVAALAQRNVVEQLEQYGWLQRLNHSEQRLQGQLAMLAGSGEALQSNFEKHWSRFQSEVTASSALPFREYSERFAPKQRSPMKNALKVVTGNTLSAGEELNTIALVREAPELWNEWSAERLKDTISQFELSEAEHSIPVRRFKAERKQENLSTQFGESWEQQVTQAVANPGESWQRQLYKICSWLRWVLPVVVCVWIATRVFSGFVDGAQDRTAYVGLDFLVNGLMLVGLAWLVPQIATHFSKPSVPNAVRRSLSQALEQDLQAFADPYRAGLLSIDEERQALHLKALELTEKTAEMRERFNLLENSELDGLLLSNRRSGTRVV